MAAAQSRERSRSRPRSRTQSGSSGRPIAAAVAASAAARARRRIGPRDRGGSSRPGRPGATHAREHEKEPRIGDAFSRVGSAALRIVVAGDAGTTDSFNGVGRSCPRSMSAKLGVGRESGEPCTLLRPQIPCAPLRRCRSMESFRAKAGATRRGPIPAKPRPFSPVRNKERSFDVSPFNRIISH